jgi:hypothetical protein
VDDLKADEEEARLERVRRHLIFAQVTGLQWTGRVRCSEAEDCEREALALEPDYEGTGMQQQPHGWFNNTMYEDNLTPKQERDRIRKTMVPVLRASDELVVGIFDCVKSSATDDPAEVARTQNRKNYLKNFRCMNAYINNFGPREEFETAMAKVKELLRERLRDSHDVETAFKDLSLNALSLHDKQERQEDVELLKREVAAMVKLCKVYQRTGQKITERDLWRK